MALRFPQFAAGVWVRTCQECSNKQAMKSPEGQKSENWREAKCRKCKSEGSLDYGTENAEISDDWED